MVDILDGRERGTKSDLPIVPKRTADESLQQLRKAVRMHAVRTRLVRENDVVPVPSNEDELEAVLSRGRSMNATVLVTRLDGIYADGDFAAAHGLVMVLNYLFLSGLAPSLVVFSLPLSKEYASAKVSAFLVDPNTGRVLAEFEASHTHLDEKVTAWGYSPPHELKNVLYETMQKVFERAALQAGAVATAKPTTTRSIGDVFFGDA